MLALLIAALLAPSVTAATSAQLTAFPKSTTAGATINVRGSAFPKNMNGTVALDSATSGAPFRTSGTGSFSISVGVPVAASTGLHGISARDSSNGTSTSGTILASTSIMVVSFPSPEPTATPAPTATPVPIVAPPPAPTATPAPTPTPTPIPMATPTRSMVLGAYIPGAPSDPTQIDAYAAQTGTMPHIVMWFQQWAGAWSAFHSAGADAILARGAMPLITWEPWAGAKDDPAWSLNTIINGSHDAYVHQWTRDVATWGQPVYVRLMHEMNGPWSAWGYGVNGNTAAQYVAAWRHIVDIANTEGATNIRWVWCPNEDDGDPRYASYVSLYPGDAYVDWVGIDGYNWGTTQSWSTWQELYTVFKSSIDKMRAVTQRPLMIGETGSTELGGDKAAWIQTGFARLLTDLPQVEAVVWFDKSQQADWRVDSSTESLAAFRAAAGSGAFAGTLP